MDLLELLILIVLAGICGAVAQLIVGYNPGGLFVCVIVGVVGSYIGTVLGQGLLPWFEVRVGPLSINLLWGILGSTLLLALLSVLRSGRRAPFLPQSGRPKS